MFDIDEIRKEVAIKHGVVIGKDDPLFVTVTVHQLILERYLDLISQRYDAANRDLSAAIQEQVEQSKDSAGRIITDASDYVANEVRQAVQSSMQEAAAQIRQQLTETQTLSRQAIAASREAQTAKNGSNIAAILAGAAAVIAVIALIIVLVK
ncbi:TPA: conjugal transfer protein TraM [Escherichia coli]|nr:conjugal transfer protein TraM [Escherichia coli]